jgi:hypothetical protein
VLDYAGESILFISLYGAAGEAGRLQAVITAHGEIPTSRIGIVAAFDFTDATPVEIAGISVLLVAGHNTAFAADALRHVEMETILLARRWLSVWDQAVPGFELHKRIGGTRGCRTLRKAVDITGFCSSLEQWKRQQECSWCAVMREKGAFQAPSKENFLVL